MGKKKGQSQSQSQNPKPSSKEQLLSTLDDFTSKENWDKFFSIRGTDDSFEWYAEWPQLKTHLLSLLGSSSSSSSSQISPIHILIPGCGNSRLSEHLYDAGFHGITNIDFSKVVISDMLRRNVRDRPNMRWRLMDMTQLQFPDETFDVVLDKGGLDALMEPEFGPKLGTQYLSEVQRVLKPGGKFICLTLAESHVLGLLFPKFRFGWEMTLHCIAQKPSSKPSLSTFMAVAVETSTPAVDQIMTSFDHSSICNKEQARGFYAALDAENKVRKEHVDGSDIIYSLDDLKLGAKGDLMELIPGRRVQLTLGGQGDSPFRYRAVLLDAQPQSVPFVYHCAVFLAPKARAHEWLFSSEEGQWMVVESSKAARLIVILLDSSHASVSMNVIQKDLSPLVRQLAPEKHDNGSQIPFMMAGDGIKDRKLVHQATSRFTGPMNVEDVVYESVDDHLASMFPSMELIFRRLTFQRTESLVQSEALLVKRASITSEDDRAGKKPISTSKSKKKEKQKSKQGQQSTISETGVKVEVDHTFLASSYHAGIIAGFSLISSYLESVISAEKKVETVVIGLGAGLLPMFLHKHMQFQRVEVVELDPEVVKIAKEYFGFYEDERLKVHVADGIKFLQNLTSSSQVAGSDLEGETLKTMQKLDILIVDVDSSECSSGLSCPAPDFVEDGFLTLVKDVLSEQGLFVTNLVSRSPSIKEMVISRIKSVFGHVFCLQLEEDVNEVVFAMKSSSNTCFEENISQAGVELEKLLKFEHPERIQGILKTTEKIKCLK